jgi:CRP/FNR family transcriptional regulator
MSSRDARHSARPDRSRPRQPLDHVAVLKQTDLFKDLPDAVLRNAAGRAVDKSLERGEILFCEDDAASGLYVVAQGEFRSVRQNVEGREQVISTEGPGAILALAPVFNGGKFYTTAIANTASQVLCIPTRGVHELCREHTELLWHVARLFSHKLRHVTELVETLALRNVDQRLAQHLLTTCQERGVRKDDGCVVEITMTQAELASRVGSTREVICRALASLEKEGLIRMTGARLVTIPDMRALTTFAGMQLQLDEPRLVSELSSDVA